MRFILQKSRIYIVILTFLLIIIVMIRGRSVSRDDYNMNYNIENKYMREYNKKIMMEDKTRLLTNSSANYANKEFCAAVNQSFINTSYVSLTPDSPIVFTQNQCCQIFMISINQLSYLAKYLQFELQIISTMPSNLYPLLTVRNGFVPYLYYDSNSKLQSLFNDFDSNGFVNRKTYQYIIIPPSNLSLGQSYYFGMYQYYTMAQGYQNLSFRYYINLRFLDTYPCPNNCSQAGVCNQTTGICKCYDPYIDEDCSVVSTKVYVDSYTSKYINPSQWSYFYYYMSLHDTPLSLSLTKANGSLNITMLNTDGTISYLPNFQNSDNLYSLDTDSEQIQIDIPIQLQNSRFGKKTLIGLYNPSSQTSLINIGLIINKQDDTTTYIIIYVIVIGITILIVVWGVITGIRYRAYRLNQSRVMASSSQIDGGQPKLPKEDIDKYFPQKKFSEFQTSLSVTCCSICLEDFVPDSRCRQILCDHIFHDTCIESWLLLHQNCPNCKKEVTKEEIEKWNIHQMHTTAILIKTKPNEIRIPLGEITPIRLNDTIDFTVTGINLNNPHHMSENTSIESPSVIGGNTTERKKLMKVDSVDTPLNQIVEEEGKDDFENEVDGQIRSKFNLNNTKDATSIQKDNFSQYIEERNNIDILELQE